MGTRKRILLSYGSIAFYCDLYSREPLLRKAASILAVSLSQSFILRALLSIQKFLLIACRCVINLFEIFKSLPVCLCESTFRDFFLRWQTVQIPEHLFNRSVVCNLMRFLQLLHACDRVFFGIVGIAEQLGACDSFACLIVKRLDRFRVLAIEALRVRVVNLIQFCLQRLTHRLGIR